MKSNKRNFANVHDLFMRKHLSQRSISQNKMTSSLGNIIKIGKSPASSSKATKQKDSQQSIGQSQKSSPTEQQSIKEIENSFRKLGSAKNKSPQSKLTSNERMLSKQITELKMDQDNDQDEERDRIIVKKKITIKLETNEKKQLKSSKKHKTMGLSVIKPIKIQGTPIYEEHILENDSDKVATQENVKEEEDFKTSEYDPQEREDHSGCKEKQSHDSIREMDSESIVSEAAMRKKLKGTSRRLLLEQRMKDSKMLEILSQEDQQLPTVRVEEIGISSEGHKNHLLFKQRSQLTNIHESGKSPYSSIEGVSVRPKRERIGMEKRQRSFKSESQMALNPIVRVRQQMKIKELDIGDFSFINEEPQ
ncbi:hypothetical protein FGO68_gene8071 [Halteria grandinella]|uniref:Uncharacterized protein n=1 Tax=Halteria grandinella TaxID=5974 RepID=A0A8J8SYG9_HALGN|nr:hypothetical protein FGO68_gene8071 [Halteria grandinella]